MQLSLDNIYISARLQKKLDRIPMYPLTTVVAPAGYGPPGPLSRIKKDPVQMYRVF